MNGTVNRQIVRIWGAENLHAFVQHIHDSPKVTVLGDRTIKIYGLFFLRRAERVSGQAGNLAHAVAVVLHLHFHPGVREFVNIKLTNWWIGRGGEDDQKLMSWPPRSPYLTPCDFLFGDMWKIVFMQARIISAFQQINRNMLRWVWDKLDHRLEICRITRGEHMEHL